MKKILFVIINMEIGGTRKSLLNLLSLLVQNKDIDINLLLIGHYGELIDLIPNGVNVLPEYTILKYLFSKNNNLSIIGKIFRILFCVLKKFLGYDRVYSKVYCYISRKVFFKYGSFDSVIGYQEGISNDLAVRIIAKKHFAWIHSDVEKWYDECFILDTYTQSNQIIFVAEATRDKFVNKFPLVAEKTRIIKNTVIPEKVINKSKIELFDNLYKDKKILLVSVGRIVEEKAFLRIIPAAVKLVNKHIDFKWIVVGDGYQRDCLEQQIKESKLQDRIVLTGMMDNPYGIMKQADLLVVSSINESQPMVIIESLILGVPVLTTRFSSAEELLANKDYGVICNNNDTDFSKALIDILDSDDKLYIMRKYAQEYRYNNDDIIRCFLSMIEV